MNKYEVLTREYQSQNKNLQDGHHKIISSERDKRQEIISNFQSHLTQIKQQIREDADKMESQNDIQKENQMLKDQYESLMKEISEKGELMDKQIEEKDTASGNIEDEMSKKIGL